MFKDDSAMFRTGPRACGISKITTRKLNMNGNFLKPSRDSFFADTISLLSQLLPKHPAPTSNLSNNMIKNAFYRGAVLKVEFPTISNV